MLSVDPIATIIPFLLQYRLRAFSLLNIKYNELYRQQQNLSINFLEWIRFLSQPTHIQ